MPDECDVHAACERLNARGERPSLRKIREELNNTGSFTTISMYMKTWRPQDAEATPVNPPPTPVYEMARQFADRLWQCAAPIAVQRADERLVSAAARVKELEGQLNELTAAADEYAAENDALRGALDQVKRELAESAAREIEKDRTIAALNGQVMSLTDALKLAHGAAGKPARPQPQPGRSATKKARKAKTDAPPVETDERQMDLEEFTS